MIAELKLIKEDNNWFAMDLMQGLKRKMNTDQVKDLFARFRSIQFDDNNKSERQQIINEFILLLSR